MSLTVDQKALVFTAAKEVLIKAMEVKFQLGASIRGGQESVNDLGDRFGTLVSKMAAALESLG